jgi:hypothetical protein
MLNSVRLTLLLMIFGIPVIGFSQEFKATFPRIGAYEIASAQRVVEPEFRQALSKHDIVILGMWRNWSGTDTVTNTPLTMRDVVVDIKRRSAAAGKNIILGKYTVYNESFSSRSNGASRDRWDKCK